MKYDQITVVFLLRNGLDAAENLKKFLAALTDFPAGYPHDLILMFKNFKCHEINTLIREHQIDPNSVLEVPDRNFDLGSYFYATTKINTEYVIFFNSYSRPQAKDWLKLYQQAMRLNSSFLVGATGSYESNGFTPPFYEGRSVSRRLYWVIRYMYRLILSILSLFNNVSFPNSHIRSNAFLTKRSLYSDYIKKHGLPVTKTDCHLIESGPHSFTRYAESKGMNPGIVDIDGRFFNLENLHNTEVFRRDKQRKLVVSDNRSREFQDTSSDIRRSLEWDAWRGRY
jgi:hypothetical protein